MTITLDQVYAIIQRHTTCQEKPLGMERGISAAAEICGLIANQNEALEKQRELINNLRESQIQMQLSLMKNLASDERNRSAWENYKRTTDLLQQSA